MRRKVNTVRAAFIVCISLMMLLVTFIDDRDRTEANSFSSVELTNIYAQGVVTLGDGSYSLLGGCPDKAATDPDVQQFGPTDVLQSGWIYDSHIGCPTQNQRLLMSADGVAYAHVGEPSSDARYFAAYIDGVVQWRYRINKSQCNSTWRGNLTSAQMGHDGFVYLLVRGDCTSSSSGGNGHVVKLDSNGQEVFDRNIGAPLDSGLSRLFASDQGLVVLTGFLRNVIKFLNYDGTDSYVDLTIPLDNQYQSIGEVVVGSNGHGYAWVYEYYRSSSDPCIKQGGIKKVIHFNPGGIIDTFNLMDSMCVRGTIAITPDNGAILYTLPRSSSVDDTVYYLSPDGAVLTEIAALSDTGISEFEFVQLTVDSGGKIVLAHHTREARYLGEPAKDRHIEIRVLDPLGELEYFFSTEEVQDPDLVEVYSLPPAIAPIGVTTDSLIVPICNGDCSTTTNHQQLYRLHVPSLGLDFPRSEVPMVREQLNYVALGDSFSSGEGVEPFDPATDTIGPPENRCHRSLSAYPKLLDQDPSLGLSLQDFRACSGATTQSMVDGMNGESGQLDSLNADTDVVTMTAGGNNVYFDTFVRNCLTPGTGGCAEGTQAYNLSMDNINLLLAGHLQTLFGEVQTALTSSNTSAKVYVVGYPKVVKETSGTCNYTLLGIDEQRAAEQIIDALNQKISDTVQTFGDTRFEFIDATASGSPFEGHDMCGSEPYFYGYDANPLPPHQPEVYTAHPNAQGQEAYAELIASYLP